MAGSRFYQSSQQDASDRRRTTIVLSSVGVALVSLVATFSACGKADVRVPTFPVTGKVTFQGKAPAGAQITLAPVITADFPPDVVPVASVKDDGTFEVSTYEKNDGAPPGDYKVVVKWFKVNADGPGPNVLPKKYELASTSPIKITVKEGAPAIEPITLVK